MSENRSQFLVRHIKGALLTGNSTSDLVGKLYAAEMDRIGDEIDDGLGEGFKLGDFGAGKTRFSELPNPKATAGLKANIRQEKESDFSWVETFTIKSFENCKKFFHELVKRENVVGEDVKVQLITHKTGSMFEVYLEVSFIDYSDEDITKRPPGFIAVEEQWRTEFDAMREQSALFRDAKKGVGLETFDFDRWKPSIRRWMPQ